MADIHSYLDVAHGEVLKFTLSLNRELNTGRERLIRSHSSARFCFELSGNSN